MLPCGKLLLINSPLKGCFNKSTQKDLINVPDPFLYTHAARGNLSSLPLASLLCNVATRLRCPQQDARLSQGQYLHVDLKELL